MTPNTWWATRHVVSFAALSVLFLLAAPAQAHRDGCHRWHSCPSDTGSYVCGDLGYTTECGGTAASAAGGCFKEAATKCKVRRFTSYIGKRRIACSYSFCASPRARREYTSNACREA